MVGTLRFAHPTSLSLKKQNAGADDPPRRSFSNLASSLRGVEARDCLRLEIFLQTVAAPFAAVAGLLVAAERRGAVVRHALQIDVAGADLAADLARAIDRTGRHVTCK